MKPQRAAARHGATAEPPERGRPPKHRPDEARSCLVHPLIRKHFIVLIVHKVFAGVTSVDMGCPSIHCCFYQA